MNNIINKINELLKFRDNKIFKNCLYIFMGLTGVYFMYIYINIWMGNSQTKLMFSLIPIFFVIAFLRKNDPIYLIGEFITIAGDIALMLIREEAIGFPIYIFVQVTYAIYFYFRDNNIKRKRIIVVIRVGLSLISILIGKLVMKDEYDFKMACAVIYYLNILINLAYAIIFKDVILIIGFSLFAISDLVIGLRAIVPSSSAFKKFLDAYNWIHIFYLPSQAVLVFNNHHNDYQAIFKRKENLNIENQ